MSNNDNLPEKPEVDDNGVKTFLVGGIAKELKFTAAMRMRLFINLTPDQIQNYVTSDMFRLNALAYLLMGKDALNKTGEDILDYIEEIQLTDSEAQEIHAWVLKRTLNFMLNESKAVAEGLKEIVPNVQELHNTLTGLKR